MQTDFLDAHERHWDDAEFLFQGQRLANADHLYGVAAECGLKRLMVLFGMSMDSAKGRPSLREDQKHADEIWSRFEGYRTGHHLGTSYALSQANPFDDWQVSQRYASRSNFDRTRAVAHQGGASEVRTLVKQALRDGLI